MISFLCGFSLHVDVSRFFSNQPLHNADSRHGVFYFNGNHFFGKQGSSSLDSKYFAGSDIKLKCILISWQQPFDPECELVCTAYMPKYIGRHTKLNWIMCKGTEFGSSCECVCVRASFEWEGKREKKNWGGSF